MDDGDPGFRATIIDGVVHLAGDVEGVHVVAVTDALFQALGASDGRVVIDLSGVTFCDSSGLSCLLRLRMRSNGRQVVLRDPPPAVTRLLALGGVEELFDIERTGRQGTPA